MPQTIVIATHNADKAGEFRGLLAPLGFDVKSLFEFAGAPEPEETGSSFEENARIKAKAALEFTGLACLADDSGLCVNALGGAPGIFSARYGGFTTAAERNAHLLRQMEKASERKAEFVCHIICLFPDGREISAEGRCRGEILREPRGSGGFGYDPLFFLPELGMSMAELTEAEKGRVSHRGFALRALAKALKS